MDTTKHTTIKLEAKVNTDNLYFKDFDYFIGTIFKIYKDLFKIIHQDTLKQEQLFFIESFAILNGIIQINVNVNCNCKELFDGLSKLIDKIRDWSAEKERKKIENETWHALKKLTDDVINNPRISDYEKSKTITKLTELTDEILKITKPPIELCAISLIN